MTCIWAQHYSGDGSEDRGGFVEFIKRDLRPDLKKFRADALSEHAPYWPLFSYREMLLNRPI